jgi:hypothetical protein
LTTALAGFGPYGFGCAGRSPGLTWSGSHPTTPALCLAAAAGRRKGLAEHVGALPAAEIVELDFAGASTVGALLRDGVEWRLGHAVDPPVRVVPDGLEPGLPTPDEGRLAPGGSVGAGAGRSG